MAFNDRPQLQRATSTLLQRIFLLDSLNTPNGGLFDFVSRVDLCACFLADGGSVWPSILLCIKSLEGRSVHRCDNEIGLGSVNTK